MHMASEYNSKLITKLYTETQPSQIEEILHEMSDIGDPIFIYPIFEKWKTQSSAFNSHYYISALEDINSPDVLKIALEMFSLSERLTNRIWIIRILIKKQYIDPKFTDFTYSVIFNFVSSSPPNSLIDIDLIALLDYLKLTNQIDRVTPYLRIIILNESNSLDIRRVALYYLLRIDPKAEIKMLIDQFQIINTESLAGIIAKEIISWKGGDVPKLIELLRHEGRGRSKDIIEEYFKNKTQEKQLAVEKQTKKYSNIDIVIHIGDLIKQINTQASINLKIEDQLFRGAIQFIEQLESAQSIDQLRSKCIALRESFEDISDKTSEHGLSAEDCKKILNVKEELFNKPLNRLVLFLNSRNVIVDSNLFGLRHVNQLANLLMHPREEGRLITILQQLKLHKLYEEEKWQELHKAILDEFNKSLEKMLIAIEKNKS